MFRYEREMTEPVERWLRQQGFATRREFITPWGMCDLVAASLNKRSIQKRLALGQRRPIGSRLRVDVLLRIPEKGEGHISLAVLARAYSGIVSKEAVESLLAQLINAHFVEETRSREYCKLNGWFPLEKRLLAVELKLSRVNEALAQAVLNKKFARQSYVAVPANVASRVQATPKLDEFRNQGIGLMSVSRDSCRCVLKATLSARDEPGTLRVHCIEQFWKALIRGNSA